MTLAPIPDPTFQGTSNKLLCWCPLRFAPPQSRFHPNNDIEAISGTFRASTQVEKRGERPRSGHLRGLELLRWLLAQDGLAPERLLPLLLSLGRGFDRATRVKALTRGWRICRWAGGSGSKSSPRAWATVS